MVPDQGQYHESTGKVQNRVLIQKKKLTKKRKITMINLPHQEKKARVNQFSKTQKSKSFVYWKKN